MAQRRWTFLKNRKLAWAVMLSLAALDAAGLYLLATGNAGEAPRKAIPAARAAAPEAPRHAIASPPTPAPPPPAIIQPPDVAQVLQSGTLIVISKASQRMFVFSDGALWASAPVSTGRHRHATPSGVFPILQKRRYHRSNIYSRAPMPFMQRLTWEGIALHAGWVPGYPASHGCVRLPGELAGALFRLTDTRSTRVVIGDEAIETDAHALQFALTADLPVYAAPVPPDDLRVTDPRPADPPIFQLAAVAAALSRTAAATDATDASAPPSGPAANGPGETIQLVAAVSRAEAEAHWARLVRQRPDLGRFQKRVEPAMVNARPVYRLRASGSDAHNLCEKLKSEGIGCFSVS